MRQQLFIGIRIYLVLLVFKNNDVTKEKQMCSRAYETKNNFSKRQQLDIQKSLLTIAKEMLEGFLWDFPKDAQRELVEIIRLSGLYWKVLVLGSNVGLCGIK